MSSKRRTYTATEKADVVRMRLVDKMAVSDIAEKLDIHPTLINDWIRVVMAQAERAFDDPRTAKAQGKKSDREIDKLKKRIEQKNEVIAELMQENIQAKKDSGEL